MTIIRELRDIGRELYTDRFRAAFIFAMFTAVLGLGVELALPPIKSMHLPPAVIIEDGWLDELQDIQEDDPRWNCLTMGNQECGPTPAIGE